MDIKEYKCPNCGGAVKFDSSVQKMKCPYCDTEFEITVLEEEQKRLAEQSKDNFDWGEEKAGETLKESELDNLSSGVCPSCGAELLGDANTVAMICPCCGNAQIVSKRLSGFLKPDYVIPFKQDKISAVEALKKFSKNKRLLPDFFTEDNHINNIQGLYVPFWLFDAEVSGCVYYKASKVERTQNYTKTNYYSVLRDGNITFKRIPVDGSEKMDDKYMDAIEPFDYAQMKKFHTTYLAGYTAEKYDVDAKKSKERAAQRIKTSVEQEFARSATGYNSVEVQSSSINVKDGKVSYVLFPVWILNTKYKNENYLFIMNGESGRLVGRLPIDSTKTWKYSFIYTGISGSILTACLLAYYFITNQFFNLNPIWLTAAWVLALVGGFAFVRSWKAQMNTALLKNEANAYISGFTFKRKSDTFLYSKVSEVMQQVTKTVAVSTPAKSTFPPKHSLHRK